MLYHPAIASLFVLVSSLTLASAADVPSAPLVWIPSEKKDLSLPAESHYQRILPRVGVVEFLVRTTGDAGATVQLRRGDRSEGGQSLRVRPGGWQRLAVPLSMLGLKPGGGPGFILSAPSDSPGLEVAAATDPAWPVGPGMSDGQFLDLLDLDRPELAAVRAAKQAGDQAKAMTALAQHFRTRTSVNWTLPDPPTPGDEATAAVAAANRVVKGEFTMLINTVKYPGGVIDWNLDPTAGSPNQTHEWIWSIGRHEFTSKLLAGHFVNANPVYPQFWAKSLHSWTEAMPQPATPWELPGSGWRYIETGLRMGEFWPHSWFGLTTNPAVADGDLLIMAKSVWEHGEFLARGTTNRTNHFVIGLTGQYMAATLFPEFSASAQWRRSAAQLLTDFVTSRTDADGGWYERSPSYHRWLVEKITLVLNTARINGQDADFSPPFRTHMRRMAEWGVRLSAPDRIVPSSNDSTNDPVARFCTPAIRAELPAGPVLPWAASLSEGAAPGVAPLPASELLADSGFGVMRTSWKTDASYLLFDVGPMGGGHGHLDALNLIYAPDGVMTVFDGTGGTYNASAFRPWSVSTASHNAVLVDRANQSRPKDSKEDPVGRLPADTPQAVFTTIDGGIYACGWHVGGFGKDASIQVRHRREILFAQATGVVVVIDTLTPQDAAKHRYDLRWHLRTTTWHLDPTGSIVLPERQGRTLMAVIPLMGQEEVHADSGVMKPEILGWDVLKSNPSTEPVPALTVRHLRTVEGPTTFVTALVPGSQLGSKPPVVTRTAEGWQIDSGNGKPPLHLRLDDSCHLQIGTLTVKALRTTIP